MCSLSVRFRGRPVPGSLLLLALLVVSSAPVAAQGPAMPQLEHLATWTPRIVPNDIALNPDDGSFAVVDAGHGRIEIIRQGGTHKAFRIRFDDPRAADWLPGGVLLVAEAGPGSVRGFDADGSVVLTLGSGPGEFQAPNDIAVHPTLDRIYVVDSAAHAVKAYRASDGSFEFQFGSQGRGAGEMDWPVSLAVNPDLARLYVGDFHNRRIDIFSDDGMFLGIIGRKGKRDYSMGFIAHLFVDDEDRIYVVQSLGGFVQVFAPSGQYLGRIGEHGTGPGQLRAAKAVVIDGHNRLLASSYLDRKIELWGMDDFSDPEDILVAGEAVPSPINRGHREFKVVLQFGGIIPGEEEVDPDAFRINGAVEPVPGSYRTDPDRVIRFPTAPLFETLPAGASGPVVLTLSGETTAGNRFTTEIPIKVVPDPPRRR